MVFYHSNVVMWLAMQTRELMFMVHFEREREREECKKCKALRNLDWFYKEKHSKNKMKGGKTKTEKRTVIHEYPSEGPKEHEKS